MATLSSLLLPNSLATLQSDVDAKLGLDGNSNLILPEEVQAKCYLETKVTLSGTTPAIQCHLGNYFVLDPTAGNTTFTFDFSGIQLSTNEVYSFTLKVKTGGTHTLSWPASVDWPEGTAPDSPASGVTNTYVFYTEDGGVIWYGMLSMGASA
jgi:hypothetical protein